MNNQTTVTDAMVARFLSWQLPQDFAPDAGVSFNPRNGQLMPTGTNLLHAGQARAMLEHVLGVAEPATTSIPLRSAMDIVCAGLRDDLDYAWSWHCNVAMAAVDAGCPRDVANEGAARFMQLLANVDTRKHAGFAQTQAKSAPDTRPNPEQTAPAPSVEPENKQLTDQFGSEPATKVTPDMISRVIHDSAFHYLPDTQITVCVITLTNGTKLLGYNYGSIDPDAQDWEQGRNSAYNMAREKIWELEGYALRERLAQGGGV